MLPHVLVALSLAVSLFVALFVALSLFAALFAALFVALSLFVALFAAPFVALSLPLPHWGAVHLSQWQATSATILAGLAGVLVLYLPRVVVF